MVKIRGVIPVRADEALQWVIEQAPEGLEFGFRSRSRTRETGGKDGAERPAKAWIWSRLDGANAVGGCQPIAGENASAGTGHAAG